MKCPIATVAVILEKNGKIVIIKRGHKPFKGRWALPGGHIRCYESALKAAVREAKEETGLTCKLKFLTYYNEIFPKQKWHAVVSIFTGKCSGTLKKRKWEIQDIGWFSKERVKKLNFAFNHKRIILDYMKSQISRK